MNNIIKVRKENNTLSENLNETNQVTFTDMVCYLRVSGLSEYHQEEIISDILGMFLGWQEDTKSIESMIGYDYKKFVDDIIDASPKMTIFQKFQENLKLGIDILGILLTIDFVFKFLLEILITHNYNLKFDYTVGTLMKYLIIYVFSVCIVNYIGKNSFKLSKIHFSKGANFLFGVIFFLVCMLFAFISKGLLKHIIISINFHTMLALVSIFLIYKLIISLLKNKA